MRFVQFLVFFYSFNLTSQIDNFYIKNTGVNMTVAILNVDNSILPGDTIVALYIKNENHEKSINPIQSPENFNCGGLTVWNGKKLAVAVWGNDYSTDYKDGFHSNEKIHWYLVRNNTYKSINMDYRVGNLYWEANGIHIIEEAKIDGG
tara:strand:- start:154 stop:597 length:444 start_codon:yes stop_codon:yes gene_type:complete